MPKLPQVVWNTQKEKLAAGTSSKVYLRVKRKMQKLLQRRSLCNPTSVKATTIWAEISYSGSFSQLLSWWLGLWLWLCHQFWSSVHFARCFKHQIKPIARNGAWCLVHKTCKCECDTSFDVTNAQQIICNGWTVFNSYEKFAAKTALWHQNWNRALAEVWRKPCQNS